MKNLIFYQVKIFNKVHNLLKYSVTFLVFSILSITLINDHGDIDKFGLLFSVISTPLMLIGLSANIIKPDIEDGSLEFLITTSSSYKILLAKYIALSLSLFSGFLLVLPIITIVFSVNTKLLIALIISNSLLIFLVSSLILAISLIQAYFQNNTNFLTMLIMPLVIPMLIFSGMLINEPAALYLMYLMIGINLIIIPIVIYLSVYLLKNIYHI